jgi:tRNA (guanine37-N1)-methyltransferase
MQIDVVTLFPGLFETFTSTGVLGRAVAKGLLEITTHDLRRWAGNRWGQVDDEPYGGGAGMVLRVAPTVEAVEDLLEERSIPPRLLMMTPRGRLLDQQLAQELSNEPGLMILCGRYEGFDERVVELLHPDEISIGDYVLGGGEVAAMVVVEAVSRLLPGVVGDPESVEADSFTGGLLDYPCFTRPERYEGRQVPGVLLSGHHGKIRRWRLQQSVELTVTRRPDLVKKNWARYSAEVRSLVRRYAPELARSCENDE